MGIYTVNNEVFLCLDTVSTTSVHEEPYAIQKVHTFPLLFSFLPVLLIPFFVNHFL